MRFIDGSLSQGVPNERWLFLPETQTCESLRGQEIFKAGSSCPMQPGMFREISRVRCFRNEMFELRTTKKKLRLFRGGAFPLCDATRSNSRSNSPISSRHASRTGTGWCGLSPAFERRGRGCPRKSRARGGYAGGAPPRAEGGARCLHRGRCGRRVW